MKQLNVQQQNEVVAARIRAVALAARSESVWYRWLRPLLDHRGLSIESGYLVRHQCIPEQGGYLHQGVWLTYELEFWQLEVTVEYGTQSLQGSEARCITAEVVVSEHEKGIGKSFGFLAIEAAKALGL